MVVIIALGVLAGGFAYSMKVEMKLARNNTHEEELQWLGRSGVEYAKWVLAEQWKIAGEPYDSLNQKWAGGPGSLATSNSPLADVALENIEVGEGIFSLKIVDLERKFNINVPNTKRKQLVEQALTLMGVDASEFPVVTDSIEDWIDRDDLKGLSGAESQFYSSGQNPYFPKTYFAKNGPIDDISELLMINGITPAMYWGPRYVGHQNQALLASPSQRNKTEQTYPFGLIDFFTTISLGPINVNTAPAEVLQLIPSVDENTAHAILNQRAGPDGVDGTEDDVPFKSTGELINVPGLSRQAVNGLQQQTLVVTRSYHFEVTVAAQIGDSKKEFIAVVRRNNQNDIQVLRFYWK